MENTTRTPLPMASTGCACCTPTTETPTTETPTTDIHATDTAATDTADTTSVGVAMYRVQGMTCGHCVASVTEELSALDGVTAVDVDLVAGGLSAVTVTGPVVPGLVRAAIEEAGYTLIA